MSFRVDWCNVCNRFKGTCDLHPMYSQHGDSAEEAMEAIIALVGGLDMDNEPTDVDCNVQFDDTLEVTNVNWPPFRTFPN